MLCLSLSGALLESACGSLPARGDDTAAQAGAIRAYQQQIQISGRITAHYQQNGKPQTLPAGFDWEQSAGGIVLTLYSPLGQTIARISQDAHGARLEQEGQSPRWAADLNQLAAEALGWPLPVSGLRDWLQGYVRQTDGRLQRLAAQDQTLDSEGWQLRYASWQDPPDFPKRIDLHRYTDEAGEVSLRIVIDQWKTP
ncbi:MAG: outer membrane lipoprotein LolB [Burkholderiales bacterium]|nr:outer membrane lipoprotein LolB [Burkholderiales bacterium]